MTGPSVNSTAKPDPGPRLARLKREFESAYGSAEGIRFFRAAGRVNLIGEHTDYNEGFVLPACIDRSIVCAVRPNHENVLRLKSLNAEPAVECPLDNIVYDPQHGWANYPKGVARVLLDAGCELPGLDLLFEADLPQAAGLSSSASLETAMCLALAAGAGVRLDQKKVPVICRQAENTFMNVPCGIMDQFVITFGRKDHALFLDCRSMAIEQIPFPSNDFVLVIADTKKPRPLVASAYAERRKECADAVLHLSEYIEGGRSLRDIPADQFEMYKGFIPETLRKRAEHVIYENRRVLAATGFLKKGKLEEFGKLLYESHASLKDLFEVSCPELDYLVETARSVPGVLGSRMTGAGFGGCTVTIAKPDCVSELIEKMASTYQERFKTAPDIFACATDDGASEIQL